MELLIREHLVLSLEKNTVEEWEKTYMKLIGLWV